MCHYALHKKNTNPHMCKAKTSKLFGTFGELLSLMRASLHGALGDIVTQILVLYCRQMRTVQTSSEHEDNFHPKHERSCDFLYSWLFSARERSRGESRRE